MSSAPRFTGQDVQISVVVGQESLLNVIAIASFEWTYKIATKEQGYLGETADRVDEIYKNINGTLEFHAADADVFTLIDVIIDRARRRRPPRPRITTKGQITFPATGAKALVIFHDQSFGDIPVRVQNREEYGAFSLPFACQFAGHILL
jgi:hypothetical protein